MFHVVSSGAISGDQGLKSALSGATDFAHLRDAIIKVKTEQLSGLIGVLYGRYLTGAKCKAGDKVALGMDALEAIMRATNGSYEILSVDDTNVMTELKQSLGIEIPELIELADKHPDKSLIDMLKILPVETHESPLTALLDDEFFLNEGVVDLAPSEFVPGESLFNVEETLTFAPQIKEEPAESKRPRMEPTAAPAAVRESGNSDKTVTRKIPGDDDQKTTLREIPGDDDQETTVREIPGDDDQETTLREIPGDDHPTDHESRGDAMRRPENDAFLSDGKPHSSNTDDQESWPNDDEFSFDASSVPLIDRSAWEEAAREVALEKENGTVSFDPNDPPHEDEVALPERDTIERFPAYQQSQPTEAVFVAEESFSPTMQDSVAENGFAARPDFLPPPPPPPPRDTNQETSAGFSSATFISSAEAFTIAPENYKSESALQKPGAYNSIDDSMASEDVLSQSGSHSQAVKKWTAELAKRSEDAEDPESKVDVSTLRSQRLAAEDLPEGREAPGGTSMTMKSMQFLIATVILMGCLVFCAQYLFMSSKSEIDAAEQMLKAGDEAQATVIFNKILLANPTDVRAYLGRAKAHRNQPEEAMKDYQRVLELNPSNAEGLLGAAEYYLKKQKYIDAIAKSDAVLKMQPDNMEANKILGLSYLGQGDCKKAIDPLRKVVEALGTSPDWPDREKLRFAAARALHAEGRCDEALQYLAQAISTDNGDGNLFFFRGKLEFDKKQFDKAISDFDKAIAKGPRLAESHYYRGVCYEEKKDLKAAIDDWSSAIDGGYSTWEVFAKRGNAYFANKEYGDAVADFDDAIERNEKLEDLKKQRALAYAELRKQTSSGGVAKLAPKMPSGDLVKAGYAELQGGHLLRAVEILSEAVKRNPNNPDARRLLSSALVRSGNTYEGDQQLFVWANMQAPTPQARYKLAKSLIDSGQHRDAAVLLVECLKQNPYDTDVRVQLIRAYTLSGDTAEARRQCEAAIAGSDSPANQELYRSLMPK